MLPPYHFHLQLQSIIEQFYLFVLLSLIHICIVVHKRKSAKNLSLIEEDNLNRLNMYKYKYRNDIIISNNYNSFKVRIKVIINTSLYGIKVLFKSRKHKLKKFNIVFSSMLVALFDIKIKSSFNKRMSGK